jgi:hypothetical protein
MIIKSAKYIKVPVTGEKQSIEAELDGIMSHIPLDSANVDYLEIMKQVDAGELTIEAADE